VSEANNNPNNLLKPVLSTFITVDDGKWLVYLRFADGAERSESFDEDDVGGLATLFSRHSISSVQCSSSVDFPQDYGMRPAAWEILDEALGSANAIRTPLIPAATTEVNRLEEIFDELVKVAGRIASAGTKHTRASAELRATGQTDSGKIDREAVGRLHNAAQLARDLLEGGGCSLCTEAAETETQADRWGECEECGRVLAGVAPGDETTGLRPGFILRNILPGAAQVWEPDGCGTIFGYVAKSGKQWIGTVCIRNEDGTFTFAPDFSSYQARVVGNYGSRAEAAQAVYLAAMQGIVEVWGNDFTWLAISKAMRQARKPIS
jgi:hypothetical protein